MIPNTTEKLIGHNQSENKIDKNHGSEGREYQYQENDTNDGRIPFQIFSNSAAYSGKHFIGSGFPEFSWHSDQ